MSEFNEYNTEGYTPSQLTTLNREWEELVSDQALDEDTEEYDIEFKRFSESVSRR